MKAKKTIKQGICCIMRCKAGAANSSVNPMGMCEKHLDEWTSAGCPPMDVDDGTVVATALATTTGTDLVALQKELEEARNTATQYLQTVAHLPLDSQQSLDWLGQLFRGMGDVVKQLEEKRKAEVREFIDKKNAVDALFRPTRDACQAVVDACQLRLNQYAAEQRQLQDAALQQIQNGSRDDATIAHAHMLGPGLPAQVDTRDDYEVEVLDFAQVPDMFKVLDEQAVKQYARTRHGRVNIPGLVVRTVEHVQRARAQA